jgi:hypothetical protein
LQSVCQLFTIQAGEKPVLKAKLVLLFIGALCPLLLQIRKESAKVIGKEKSEIKYLNF